MQSKLTLINTLCFFPSDKFKKLLCLFDIWLVNENIFFFLICRHGAEHRFSPTRVNYRANIEALRLAGCTHILASTACGSLTESIGRGQLVVPDSFIDRTNSRNSTFYDGTSAKYNGRYVIRIFLL